MMRIVKSDTIPDEAIKYLQQAIEHTPACAETLESITQAIEQQAVQLWLIEETGICAAMVTSLEDNPKGGQYLNIILLGGAKPMRLWTPLLSEFFLEAAKTYTVICIGRKGWSKIFPVKEIGSVLVVTP